jgi:hypothetical protein
MYTNLISWLEWLTKCHMCRFINTPCFKFIKMDIGQCRLNVGLCWLHLGAHLGPISGPSWIHFGLFFGPYWAPFGPIGPFWVHYGAHYGAHPQQQVLAGFSCSAKENSMFVGTICKFEIVCKVKQLNCGYTSLLGPISCCRA